MAKETQPPRESAVPALRNPYWELELAKFIEDAMRRPFKWGEHDCAMMVANMVKAITGAEVAEDLRGKYDDKDSALDILSGDPDGPLFNGLEAICDERLGEAIAPSMSSKGDVALAYFDVDGEVNSLVIDNGKTYLVCFDEHGCRLVRKDAIKTIKAWRVG